MRSKDRAKTDANLKPPGTSGGAPRRMRLTAKDQMILTQLQSEAGQPVSAYDLVAKLRGQGIRYPVTVYRSLEKLIAAGLVHRIETSNAFVACTETCDAHQPLFAVCEDCGHATEFHTDTAINILEEAVSKLGFEVSQMNLELKGTCSGCRSSNMNPPITKTE